MTTNTNPEHTPYGGLRTYLQDELLRRCERRPQYSLRAFAKSLEIEPSALSKLINGKRKITKKTYEKLVERLGLSPAEVQEISKKHNPTEEYLNQHMDHFNAISDWYHYAILELTHIKSFKNEPKWVAKKLGITVSEVNIAIERLQRLKFLEITEEGHWVDNSENITTVGNEFTSVALRKLQRQILGMAQEALEAVPLEERDQSAMTMAIDSKKLTEAKMRIQKFRRELCQFLQNGDEKDRVYQLSLSLFPTDFEKNTGGQK